jgi:alkyl sulfatase BDS1-like metallo-beta-lactamase superfamily hydrolase
MNVDAPADATITAKRMAFLGLIGGVAKPADLIKSGALTITGDAPTLGRFTSLFEAPQRNFPIVTPLVPVVAK